jgi:DNA replication and repair protein RecF
VTQARRDWISARSETFHRYYAAISGGFGAHMEYRPGLDPEGAAGRDEIESVYGAALEASAERERRLGTTVVGPHRDELRMTLEGEGDPLDLREYGSGGQRRTAALALRLVEASTIREARGHEPLILLDDVFAELDAPRSERILELFEVEETGQVVITAPKPSDVRIRGGALPRWSIDSGRIAS